MTKSKILSVLERIEKSSKGAVYYVLQICFLMEESFNFYIYIHNYIHINYLSFYDRGRTMLLDFLSEFVNS